MYIYILFVQKKNNVVGVKITINKITRETKNIQLTQSAFKNSVQSVMLKNDGMFR